LVEKLRVPDTKVQEEIDARRSVDLEKAALGACQYWGQRSKRLFTLEFDRVRKSMSVIVKEVDGQRSNKLLVKVHS
jgi:Ca2+-transporting ATPase